MGEKRKRGEIEHVSVDELLLLSSVGVCWRSVEIEELLLRVEVERSVEIC